MLWHYLPCLINKGKERDENHTDLSCRLRLPPFNCCLTLCLFQVYLHQCIPFSYLNQPESGCLLCLVNETFEETYRRWQSDLLSAKSLLHEMHIKTIPYLKVPPVPIRTLTHSFLRTLRNCIFWEHLVISLVKNGLLSNSQSLSWWVNSIGSALQTYTHWLSSV